MLPGRKLNLRARTLFTGRISSMLQGSLVIAVALGYIGLLFVVASYGDRAARRWPGSPRRRLDLSAVAGDLLHELDLLRVRRARLAERLRLPHHLSRPDADDRARLARDHAHCAARQGAEHHLGRRFCRRPLRQGAERRGDGRAHRGHRLDPLYRAAAQGGVVVAQHHSHACAAGERRGPAGIRRHFAVCRVVDGSLRGAVRHSSPYRRDRASGWSGCSRSRPKSDREARGLPRRRKFSSPSGSSTARPRLFARAVEQARTPPRCCDAASPSPARSRR